MNEQILKLIKESSLNYNLTEEEKQFLINKYQSDSREVSILEKEIKDYCSYYYYQNKLTSAISNAEPLSQGKNYYVLAFDSSSNIYLQPVSITITDPDKSEVLVENSFKGTQKHTEVDDIEIAICQIGKLLDFDIVEEYRAYNSKKQKDSIIIKDIVNGNEFYDVENLKRRFDKLINNGKLRKEKWIETSENLTVANKKEDYKFAIDYGLNILKSLPSILEEDYKNIESKYFDMLIFDCLIHQSERNFKNYGILCDKNTKRYTFAPLIDNISPSILKNNDITYLNGITCNRYELIECLFYNYYDKIEKRIESILSNKNKLLQNITVILKYNLDYQNYNQTLNNIITNIKYFERLKEERTLVSKNNNAGYVNIVQLMIGLIIIIAFSVGIAYLLYCIK